MLPDEILFKKWQEWAANLAVARCIISDDATSKRSGRNRTRGTCKKMTSSF